MAKFRVKLLTIVEHTISAYDLAGAARQAEILANNLRYDSKTEHETTHASLYSVEQIGPTNANPIPDPFPFHPQPQRRAA